MIFRVRFGTTKQHVQCRLFVAHGPNRTWAMCGDFTVRQGEEFEALVKAFNAEFIAEDLDIETVKLAGVAQICEAMKQCLK